MGTNKQSAFTILELVIVIAVIAVLAGVALFEHNQATKTASATPTPSAVALGATPTASPAPTVAVAPTATATPDPTAGWKTYSDTSTGLSFKYPASLTPNVASATKGKGTDFGVTVQQISNIPDAPLWYGPDIAKAEMAALAKGDLSQTHGGDNILTLNGSAVGATNLILRVLSCDSVMFKREAHIYRNNYQIMLSLTDNDTTTMEANNPSYFGIDTGCSDSEKIWTASDKFATDLAAGKTDAESQNWYTTFQKILGTVSFK